MGALIPDMADADYRALPGVSGTAIGDLLRSPALYAWKREHPTEATPAMTLGTLVHALVLEQPHPFAANLFDYKTERKEWEARKAEILRFNKTPIPGDVWRQASDMAEAVEWNDDAHELLELMGESEATVTWNENGVPCKGRIDRLAVIPNGYMVIDLKTCRDLDEFSKSIGTYAYHSQQMHYARGAHQATGDYVARPMFIAVETSAPYRVQVFQLSEEDAAQGDAMCVEAYRRWADCTEANVWPSGVPEGVTQTNIPAWTARAWDARLSGGSA